MEGFKFYQSVLNDIKQQELRFLCVVSVLNKRSQTIVNVKLKSTENFNEAGIIESDRKNVFESESFTLNCLIHFTHEGHFPIFWMNWSYPLISDTKTPKINELQPKYSNGSGVIHIQLTVNNVSRDHEGWYTCNLLNTFAIVNSSKIFVPVFKRDANNFKFITSLNTSDVIVKSVDTNFTIDVDIYSTDDVKKLQYTWFKEDKPCIFGSTLDSKRAKKLEQSFLFFTENEDFRKGRLLFSIYKLTFNDSGLYTLVNRYQNVSISLQVQGSPFVTVYQNSIFYTENEKYSVDCKVTAFPQPKIHWEWSPCSLDFHRCQPKKNETFIELQANNVQLVNSLSTLNNDYKLRLELASYRSGIYRCVASNIHGNNSKAVFVIVSDTGEKGISMNSSALSPFEGESLRITCKSSFYVFNAIHWFWRGNKDEKCTRLMFDNMHITEKKGEYSVISQLEIVNVSLNNSGLFVCHFEIVEIENQKNKYEMLNTTIDVIAVEKPEIIDSNLNGLLLRAVPQSSTKLHCNSTGNPKPTITWFKDGNVLNSTKLHAIDIENDGFSLVIQKLAPSDSGIYECVVHNIAATVRKNITLIIEDMNLFTSKSVIIYVCTAVSISILIFVSFLILYRKHRKKSKEKERYSFTAEMRTFLQKSVWEFSKDRLKLLKMIGEGSFGIVYLAEAIGISKIEAISFVAVKTMKDANNAVHRKALLDELKIFTKIGNHINIVNLLGVVTRDVPNGQFYLIVEYCKFGNLRSYLQVHRNEFVNTFKEAIDSSSSSHKLQHYTTHCLNTRKLDCVSTENSVVNCVSSASVETQTLNSNRIACSCRLQSCTNVHTDIVTTNHLFSFSFQIAKGMQYLATRQRQLIAFLFSSKLNLTQFRNAVKVVCNACNVNFFFCKCILNLIHRDLAARNVMLADGGVVKITDFGLAKRHIDTDFYVKQSDTPLPVKWMAVESLRDNLFTSKSDVWSFGVLLWELFSLGENPYPGVSMDAEFYVKLKDGFRMQRPDNCPEVVYEIMKNCWSLNPNKRPDFAQLSEAFFALLDVNSQQYYTQLLNSEQ
ncbi:Vascular endothelial growth factor receptor 3-like protein [Leptotrombidium deliense]|uniref:receptor protein-tyrosine kinase n=1 Tax=Leptotrombidium deliense TaxID=299467 RepID=A0A443SV48_9ACAR|nr:Vascular endothelial growth factor receptor 3-like protein [Leptotrombidium deliense]